MNLTFESVDEILVLRGEHSNESYRVVLSCITTVNYALQDGSNF